MTSGSVPARRLTPAHPFSGRRALYRDASGMEARFDGRCITPYDGSYGPVFRHYAAAAAAKAFSTVRRFFNAGVGRLAAFIRYVSIFVLFLCLICLYGIGKIFSISKY